MRSDCYVRTEDSQIETKKKSHGHTSFRRRCLVAGAEQQYQILFDGDAVEDRGCQRARQLQVGYRGKSGDIRLRLLSVIMMTHDL